MNEVPGNDITMFSSQKLLLVVSGIYGLTVFLPSLFGSSDVVPATAVSTAVIACILFVAGLAIGVFLFPFRGQEMAPSAEALDAWFVMLVRLLVVISVYVMIAGPVPPMIEAFANPDSFAIALSREDAVKLNPNAVFVRIYSWGRDLVAPVVVALALPMLRSSALRGMRVHVAFGIVAALFLGLWSGQKATVVNYVIAAFIFAAPDGWVMVKRLIMVVPAVLLLIFLTFAVTQPDLFLSGDGFGAGLGVLLQSIVSRVLWIPLEVAAVFVHAVDELGIIAPLDAIPYFSSFWTPGIQSIENRIAIEFYHQGIDSGHSNALAFAYAYVLGGMSGSFFGGIAMAALLRVAISIIVLARYPVVNTVFGAYLCYVLLDMLNGNFVQYLIKVIVLAVLLWLASDTWRFLHGTVTTDGSSSAAEKHGLVHPDQGAEPTKPT